MTDFYHVPFGDVGEGADLVASLSRQLALKQIQVREMGPVEVGIVASSSGADIYASAAAVAAIAHVSASPLIATKIDLVPQNVVWILRGGEKRFLGRGDVLSKIIPEPDEPLYTQHTAVGVVKFWRDDKGYGVIESPETKPWGIWCSFGSIAPTGGIATLPSGEHFSVTYDENGRALSPSGDPVTSGFVTGIGFRSLAVNERVEVRYHRANQESYRYIALWVRRIGQ